MELRDGPRAAGASGRDLRGRGSIAGMLRTAVGEAGADSFFANCGRRRRRWSSGMDLELLGRAAATYGVAARSPGCCAPRLGRPGLIPFSLIAVGAGGDGAQGWTSSCWGERPRPTGSRLDRRAVAHSGWGSQACSLSVDVVERQRHAAIRGAPAAMELKDGPRAAGASGRDLR